MSKIHPTAIIEEGASIGEDVKIGPYCFIRRDVVLGDKIKLIITNAQLNPKAIIKNKMMGK